MRDEITEALQRARTFRQTPMPPAFQESPDASLDYSQFISDEARSNMARISRDLLSIQSCLKTSQVITDSYLGSATSIVALVDKDERNELVVELTRFGPLAAIFTYGTVPAAAIDLVNHCTDSLGLIRLGQNEITELEANGSYLELFE